MYSFCAHFQFSIGESSSQSQFCPLLLLNSKTAIIPKDANKEDLICPTQIRDFSNLLYFLNIQSNFDLKS